MTTAEATATPNNVMRQEYKTLTEADQAAMLDIKNKGLALYEAIEKLSGVTAGGITLPGTREMSIAKTKCEEAVMWAVKHITK